MLFISIKRSLKLALVFSIFILGCHRIDVQNEPDCLAYSENVLDYKGRPASPDEPKPLAFSDQGAWFAYGFSENSFACPAFSGPFIMLENGYWSSEALVCTEIKYAHEEKAIDFSESLLYQKSYNSHLEQCFEKDSLRICQRLFFPSPHIALLWNRFSNPTGHQMRYSLSVKGGSLPGIDSSFIISQSHVGLCLDDDGSVIYIIPLGKDPLTMDKGDRAYRMDMPEMLLEPGEEEDFFIANVLLFPGLDSVEIFAVLEDMGRIRGRVEELFKLRKAEKQRELIHLASQTQKSFRGQLHKTLLAKAVLSLQNNWRYPRGELRHSGFFPSYHYKWFNGFWAWDSWKHAAAVAYYNPSLAQKQILAMYDFQDEEGFIPDCIFADTSLEKHNYRNSKPPLSAWAVWKIFEAGHDKAFLEMMYPLIVLQHEWWYKYRDHDHDGLCEYGCTDGSLIAAKWESGMDNAVRFDSSRLLRNSDAAYSLDQESVDLNAYLFAEKGFLANMATILNKGREAEDFLMQAERLKSRIQSQFFDEESQWFYDTSLDGEKFIKIKGCEGWTSLWARAASKCQAEALRNQMMDTAQFFTRMPFPTLCPHHPAFEPESGYWRGPVWLDQAFFAVKGLGNYGFCDDGKIAVDKLINNAEGLIQKGPSIRENYNPVNGQGLEAENFSWSAASYILMMMDDS